MFENFDWSQIPIFSGDFADFQHLEDVVNVILCTICVISAGLAAGLTMGLLSLDVTKLEIKSMTGSDVDRADAEAILPIVKKHHLLLVTLLLFNSMANEALPVFLSALLPEWLSVLVSVTLVLLFGEILPSAFFTGKAQLHTAAIMIPFVKGLTVFFWPIGYPLSRCLDYVFGVEEETSVISREELGALVYLQNSDRSRRKETNNSNRRLESHHNSIKTNDTLKNSPSMNSLPSLESEQSEEGLSMYEIKIMTGILKLAKLHVRDSMIKIKNVFMISDSTRLDSGTLESLWNSGFSRIPVFKRRDKQHIIGYLLIKSLILVSADDKVPVETLPIRQPFFVKPGLRLLEMLSIFREGRCHLALVTDDPITAMKCMEEGKRPSSESSNVIGIVTLEDVIEEILQGEITDETDAMPSVFPNNSGSRPGGTSAMGLLSMGRTSLMHKTSSTASIIKMSNEMEKKLVKKSISANNYSGPKSVAYLMKNTSISTTAHKPTKDESDSRKNWQERNSMYHRTHKIGGDHIGLIRKSGDNYGSSHHHSYGAVDMNDDSTDGNSCCTDNPDEISAPLSSQADGLLSVRSDNSRDGILGVENSNGNGLKAGVDNYELGNEGYRIIKSKTDLDYGDIEEQKINDSSVITEVGCQNVTVHS